MIELNKWMLWFVDEDNKNYSKCKTIKELKRNKYDCFEVKVPCEFENELQKNGYLDDLYFSDNIFCAQKYEYYHQWYSTNFYKTEDDSELILDGIDTIADIFLNGKYLGSTDNKFLEYRFSLKGLQKKLNEIVIHIYPAIKAAYNQDVGMGNYSFDYNISSLSIRKSPCSYGWDIFPRILGGGIWKPVHIKEREKLEFDEAYLYTRRVYDNMSEIGAYYSIKTDINLKNCEIVIEGACKDSKLYHKRRVYGNKGAVYFDFENPKLWNPIGYGEQNLYDVSFKLFCEGRLLTEKKLKFGIRTIKLLRTAQAEPDGKFEFIVNNKKIFVLGTNWVPLDCFHTKSPEKLSKALGLVKDLSCNMVRVWGGGYYESEEFYNYCDENGILVWQDFMMACAVYPHNDNFANMLRKEATYIVKKLRQHTSIALWSGDNECDCAHNWVCVPRDPTDNVLTRNILPQVIKEHDFIRPFLPSSPYMEGDAYMTWNLAEWHQWAQGVFFKDDAYKNLPNEFISETGYLGLPSINSLKEFLREPEKFYLNKEEFTPEYLAHLCSMEDGTAGKYVFRMPCIFKHAKDLFGYVPDDLNDLVQMTQISQAEALKYFIERLRIKKERNGGIIIWNLLDGYTQISDAVVDYYFRKKLSYYYIKRSQQRLCLIFDEPNPDLELYCVNDNLTDETITYKVTDLESGQVVISGEVIAKKDSSIKIGKILEKDLNKTMYLIEWTTSKNEKFKNHYFAKMPNIDYNKYLLYMERAGFEHFE